MKRMDNFRRTIIRRHNLLKFVEEKLGEVQYSNEPIGYCSNEGCTKYNHTMHKAMKEGMLEGIAEIEKALALIKKSIAHSNE